MTDIARDAWRKAVTSAAEKARAKFPAAVDAIDLAEQIVLAGEVELHTDGAATVASQRDDGTTYTVQGQRCSCPRGTFAPGRSCVKHTFAVLLYRRALEDTKAQVEETVSAKEPGAHDPATVGGRDSGRVRYPLSRAARDGA